MTFFVFGVPASQAQAKVSKAATKTKKKSYVLKRVTVPKSMRLKTYLIKIAKYPKSAVTRDLYLKIKRLNPKIKNLLVLKKGQKIVLPFPKKKKKVARKKKLRQKKKKKKIARKKKIRKKKKVAKKKKPKAPVKKRDSRFLIAYNTFYGSLAQDYSGANISTDIISILGVELDWTSPFGDTFGYQLFFKYALQTGGITNGDDNVTIDAYNGIGGHLHYYYSNRTSFIFGVESESMSLYNTEQLVDPGISNPLIAGMTYSLVFAQLFMNYDMSLWGKKLSLVLGAGSAVSSSAGTNAPTTTEALGAMKFRGYLEASLSKSTILRTGISYYTLSGPIEGTVSRMEFTLGYAF